MEPTELSVLEALHSTPARRYLSAEPIPDDVVWALLDAAVRGPSGGNTQRWGWVVVTDQDKKDRLAAFYKEGWDAAYGHRKEEILANGGSPDGTLSARSYLAADHLAAHLAEAPVFVIPVLRKASRSTDPRLGASVYGAVQQLCLAARAYGIGSTLTTLHTGREDDVRALLGLPDDALTMALIPLGYPAKGRWAQPKRRPLAEVVHFDSWGSTRER